MAYRLDYAALMRLEDLEVFRAAHETGGFQRAALRCGLSLSAVTKVVRKLEDAFGVQLLERGGRLLALTPAGRALYQRAMELSELTATTRRDMAAEVASLRGAIRLGVVPAEFRFGEVLGWGDGLKVQYANQGGVGDQVALAFESRPEFPRPRRGVVLARGRGCARRLVSGPESDLYA